MFIMCVHKGEERLVEVKQNRIVIGRASSTYGTPDLDLRPDKNVSRQHAQLWWEQGSYWIEDMGSRLGVLVNGTRLKLRRRISFGDKIFIGATLLQLVPSEEAELKGHVAPPKQ